MCYLFSFYGEWICAPWFDALNRYHKTMQINTVAKYTRVRAAFARLIVPRARPPPQ